MKKLWCTKNEKTKLIILCYIKIKFYFILFYFVLFHFILFYFFFFFDRWLHSFCYMTIKIYQHGITWYMVLCRNKMFHVAQEVIWCRQKLVDVARKSVSCQHKKVDVARKSISCRRKQDDAAPKNTLCSKKLAIFLERCAITLIN